MAVRYKKLWKALIDEDMKQKDLRTGTGMGSASIAELVETTTSQPMSLVSHHLGQ
jgi:DNA-binding Xre family transcriptional regulator